jgi:hypothetical protein
MATSEALETNKAAVRVLEGRRWEDATGDTVQVRAGGSREGREVVLIF